MTACCLLFLPPSSLSLQRTSLNEFHNALDEVIQRNLTSNVYEVSVSRTEPLFISFNVTEKSGGKNQPENLTFFVLNVPFCLLTFLLDLT